MSVFDFIPRQGKIDGHRPWPRWRVDHDTWRAAAATLADGRVTLLGLWGDRIGEQKFVHMALIDEASGSGGNAVAAISLDCADGEFPSVGAVHPAAIRLERAIASLYGYRPIGTPDPRPWLDLGFWDVSHPLGDPAHTAPMQSAPYIFLPVEGDSLHQIPVGPVHAGIIEPGHFRFTAAGETVVRLEQRFGYVHKGIEFLMQGADITHAAKLAARTSGDSTVAYGIAFARAVEAALEVTIPERALYLRALMAELERLANHLGDIGAICNDASFTLMHAHCGILREHVLRAAADCFGHRLMMDGVVPGGVAADLAAFGATALRHLLKTIGQRLPQLIELYDRTASLQDRTTATGVVGGELARRFGAGGYVGRASGREFDARRMPGYAPYDQLDFTVPVLTAGDVNARIWIRIREVEQSLSLIAQILDRLPNGPIAVALGGSGETAVEGLGLAEGFRGDIMVHVRLENGKLARCHLRDPSWFQWPLLEAAIEGNIVADFPLCNKSFNCSYSGHDL
jgi:Ni,Fe-hydrogenase III large subunit/Ni,Fe-hydrogenase III component G